MVAAQTATTHVPAAIGGAISGSNDTTSSTSENPAKQGRNDERLLHTTSPLQQRFQKTR